MESKLVLKFQLTFCTLQNCINLHKYVHVIVDQLFYIDNFNLVYTAWRTENSRRNI